MHRRIWGPHRSAQAWLAPEPLSSLVPWPPFPSFPLLPSSCPSLLSPRSRAPVFVIVRAPAAKVGAGCRRNWRVPVGAAAGARCVRGGAGRGSASSALPPGSPTRIGSRNRERAKARRVGPGGGRGVARAAPPATAEERREEGGGGARGGGRGEGEGARLAPCKAALFIWAQPQPPRWEAWGGRSSPTGELFWGEAEVASQAGAPGAGCGRALPARPAPPPPSRFAGSHAGLPMTGGSPANSVA